MFFMPWVCYKITPMPPFCHHDLFPTLIGSSRSIGITNGALAQLGLRFIITDPWLQCIHYLGQDESSSRLFGSPRLHFQLMVVVQRSRWRLKKQTQCWRLVGLLNIDSVVMVVPFCFANWWRMKMSPSMMTISLRASAHVFFIFSLFMLMQYCTCSLVYKG